ncbi:MAG: WD40 repeat domain-containing protein [Isosphaeraceae bacterium]
MRYILEDSLATPPMSRIRRARAKGRPASRLRFYLPGPKLSLLLALALMVCLVDTSDEGTEVPGGKVLGVHPGRVLTLAYSPDGRWLASGGYLCPVVLWDMREGGRQSQLDSSPPGICSLDFSPDGKLLAAAGEDQCVRIWCTQTWKLLHEIPAHTGMVRSLAFSPDGGSLAAGDTDGTIAVWDCASWKRLRAARTLDGPLRLVAFSPDGLTLATLSASWNARLWDRDLHERSTSALKGPHGEPLWYSSLAFAPGGTVLSMPSLSHSMSLVDLGGRPISPISRSAGGLILSLAFTPDGRTMAAGTRDGFVEIWDMTTREQRSRDHRHAGAVWSLSFSPDGRTLASAGGFTVSLQQTDPTEPLLHQASRD